MRLIMKRRPNLSTDEVSKFTEEVFPGNSMAQVALSEAVFQLANVIRQSNHDRVEVRIYSEPEKAEEKKEEGNG